MNVLRIFCVAHLYDACQMLSPIISSFQLLIYGFVNLFTQDKLKKEKLIIPLTSDEILVDLFDLQLTT